MKSPFRLSLTSAVILLCSCARATITGTDRTAKKNPTQITYFHEDIIRLVTKPLDVLAKTRFKAASKDFMVMDLLDPVEKLIAVSKTDRHLQTVKAAKALDQETALLALQQAVLEGITWASNVLLETTVLNANIVGYLLEGYIKTGGNDLVIMDGLIKAAAKHNVNVDDAFIAACKYGNQFMTYHLKLRATPVKIYRGYLFAVQYRHKEITKDIINLFPFCATGGGLNQEDRVWLKNINRRENLQRYFTTPKWSTKCHDFLACNDAFNQTPRYMLLESFKTAVTNGDIRAATAYLEFGNRPLEANDFDYEKFIATQFERKIDQSMLYVLLAAANNAKIFAVASKHGNQYMVYQSFQKVKDQKTRLDAYKEAIELRYEDIVEFFYLSGMPNAQDLAEKHDIHLDSESELWLKDLIMKRRL